MKTEVVPSEKPFAKRRRLTVEEKAAEPLHDDVAQVLAPQQLPKKHEKGGIEYESPRGPALGSESPSEVQPAKLKGNTKSSRAKRAKPLEADDSKKTTDPTIPKRGRLRRQAAVSAMAKVTEGFVEEASSIDQKRRDPGLECTKKGGRKKTTSKLGSKVVDIITQQQTESDVPELDIPQLLANENKRNKGTTKSRVKAKNTKTTDTTSVSVEPKKHILENEAIRPVKGDEHVLTEGSSPQSGRKPLAETQANRVMCSASPEKPSVSSDGTKANMVALKSAKQNKPKAELKTRAKSAKRKTKIENFQVVIDHNSVTSETISALQPSGRSVSNIHCSEGVLNGRKKFPAVSASRAVESSSLHQDPKANDETQQTEFEKAQANTLSHEEDGKSHTVPNSQPVERSNSALIQISSNTCTKSGNKKAPKLPNDGFRSTQNLATQKTSDSDRLPANAASTVLSRPAAVTSKTVAKPSRFSGDDNDMDWLIEPQKAHCLKIKPKPNTTVKPSQQKARTAANLRNLPEIDLDDLVSNIASFATGEKKQKLDQKS